MVDIISSPVLGKWARKRGKSQECVSWTRAGFLVLKCTRTWAAGEVIVGIVAALAGGCLVTDIELALQAASGTSPLLHRQRARSSSCICGVRAPERIDSIADTFLTGSPRWAWAFGRLLVWQVGRYNHGLCWTSELRFFYLLKGVLASALSSGLTPTHPSGPSLNVILIESLTWS